METGTTVESSVNHSSLAWTWNIRDIHLKFKAHCDYVGTKREWYGKWKEPPPYVFEAGVGTPLHSRWKFSVTKREDCINYFDAAPDEGLALGIHFLGFGSGFVHKGNGHKVECALEASISGLNWKNEVDKVEEIKLQHDFSTRDSERYEGFISWDRFCSQYDKLFVDNVMRIQGKLTLIGDSVTKTLVNFGQLTLQETQTMENDCGKFYNNPDFSDVSVVLIRDSANSVQFFAHKFILAARSPVFRRMLQTPTRETRENKLVIKDMNLQTLALVLQFIYKGSIEIPNDKLCIFGLMNAAKMYDLKGLSKLVLCRLQTLLDDENVGHWTVAAHECARGHDEVISVLRDYRQRRQKNLWRNPEYRKLFERNPAAFMGDRNEEREFNDPDRDVGSDVNCKAQ